MNRIDIAYRSEMDGVYFGSLKVFKGFYWKHQRKARKLNANFLLVMMLFASPLLLPNMGGTAEYGRGPDGPRGTKTHCPGLRGFEFGRLTGTGRFDLTLTCCPTASIESLILSAATWYVSRSY